MTSIWIILTSSVRQGDKAVSFRWPPRFLFIFSLFPARKPSGNRWNSFDPLYPLGTWTIIFFYVFLIVFRLFIFLWYAGSKVQLSLFRPHVNSEVKKLSFCKALIPNFWDTSYIIWYLHCPNKMTLVLFYFLLELWFFTCECSMIFFLPLYNYEQR